MLSKGKGEKQIKDVVDITHYSYPPASADVSLMHETVYARHRLSSTGGAF